jgi:hypothetical protein
MSILLLKLAEIRDRCGIINISRGVLSLNERHISYSYQNLLLPARVHYSTSYTAQCHNIYLDCDKVTRVEKYWYQSFMCALNS